MRQQRPTTPARICNPRHHLRRARARHASRRAGAAAAAEGCRQQAVSRDDGREPVLLARRHGVGALSPAQSRGRRQLPAKPGRSAASRSSRRWCWRSSTVSPIRMRTATARSTGTTPPARTRRTSRTWTGSWLAPTPSGSTSACCQHGATSGTRSGASVRKSSQRPPRRRTASGWDGDTETRV